MAHLVELPSVGSFSLGRTTSPVFVFLSLFLLVSPVPVPTGMQAASQDAAGPPRVPACASLGPSILAGEARAGTRGPSLSAGALFPVSLWLEHLGPPDGFGSFTTSKPQQAKTQHNEIAHITLNTGTTIPSPDLCCARCSYTTCRIGHVMCATPSIQQIWLSDISTGKQSRGHHSPSTYCVPSTGLGTEG